LLEAAVAALSQQMLARTMPQDSLSRRNNVKADASSLSAIQLERRFPNRHRPPDADSFLTAENAQSAKNFSCRADLSRRNPMKAEA